MGIFSRRAKPNVVVAKDPGQALAELPALLVSGSSLVGSYSHSFEDLDPGYEDVYEPVIALGTVGEPGFELIFFRWIDPTEEGEALALAKEPVLRFLEGAAERGRPVTYRVFPHTPAADSDIYELEELKRKCAELAIPVL